MAAWRKWARAVGIGVRGGWCEEIEVKGVISILELLLCYVLFMSFFMKRFRVCFNVEQAVHALPEEVCRCIFVAVCGARSAAVRVSVEFLTADSFCIRNIKHAGRIMGEMGLRRQICGTGWRSACEAQRGDLIDG
ncbi:hypothetical protein FH972_024881 [Carpinus fangiana]|uniref:Uncharacterized protein n=1 Tax=Carpinus fangiana TaxID=176857 RepID=A0A5N6KZR2_9ROSI|nr:hypothetical protein FH972_024881 [Carpinus fangiana]